MTYERHSRITARLGILVAGFLVLLSSCRTKSPSAASAQPKSPPPNLRLLVIDDPGLAKFIKREWEARSEGELILREMSTAELAKVDQRRIGADVVVYPSQLLGELATREWLAPMPKDRLDEPAYQYRDIFNATRKYELTWEEGTLAVPLGGPPLVLFYRRDLFERLSWNPPKTWSEYQKIVEQLAELRRAPPADLGVESKTLQVCEPLHDEWAAHLMLARAAAYAKHRGQFSALFDYRTMAPLIAGPPFVRALQELLRTTKSTSVEANQSTPTRAVDAILNGDCMMAIGWLANSEAESGSSKSAAAHSAPPATGIAPLPGASDVFNFRSSNWESRGTEENVHVPLIGVMGRLGSATKESQQPAEAVRLLLWLSGPEMSAAVSTASGTTAPFRDSHVSQIDKWSASWKSRDRLSQETLQQYATAIQQSLSESEGLISLRIPGRQDYLKALADGVRKAVAGQASAEGALAEVAQQWQELTDKMGTEKQRLAYARSIGLKP